MPQKSRFLPVCLDERNLQRRHSDRDREAGQPVAGANIDETPPIGASLPQQGDNRQRVQVMLYLNLLRIGYRRKVHVLVPGKQLLGKQRKATELVGS